METTEKIVEAYVRYVKGWATIPNIRCDGQYEIDLLAIDPVSLDRYHIEVGVSVSGSFSKLTANPFSPDDLKRRTRIAGARRTLGYFVERKFGPAQVVARLGDYGFEPDRYKRVVVTWGWSDEAFEEAQAADILLWDFRGLMEDIADSFERSRSYFTDDTLRTLSLFTHVLRQQPMKSKSSRSTGSSPSPPIDAS
jgi:hypothetical protein